MASAAEVHFGILTFFRLTTLLHQLAHVNVRCVVRQAIISWRNIKQQDWQQLTSSR